MKVMMNCYLNVELKLLVTFKTFLQVSQRCVKSGAMLDTVDACSLLYRLELEGEISFSLKIEIENNKTSSSLSKGREMFLLGPFLLFIKKLAHAEHICFWQLNQERSEVCWNITWICCVEKPWFGVKIIRLVLGKFLNLENECILGKELEWWKWQMAGV